MIDSTGKETTEFYPIEAHNVTNFIKVTEASIKDSYASVAGTSGNDSIQVKGTNSTVSTRNDDDTLDIINSQVLVFNEGGNDSISIYNNSVGEIEKATDIAQICNTIAAYSDEK